VPLSVDESSGQIRYAAGESLIASSSPVDVAIARKGDEAIRSLDSSSLLLVRMCVAVIGLVRLNAGSSSESLGGASLVPGGLPGIAFTGIFASDATDSRIPGNFPSQRSASAVEIDS